MNPVCIELLAPARDLACGIAAIDHGADAVYIGGPGLSARAAAHNSLDDIAKLLSYAHQFGARVYIALNTLLTDDELKRAVRLIHDVYAIGADAVIIQDPGLLECDLPPIALHASTQMDNRSLEKVRFLEREGFAQVVLARELSIQQIADIASQTRVCLEFFVHGALCVSYSGQCYISEVMAGRSANRGECAQFCRHSYTLKEQGGKVLAEDRFLLSLKDLDLSQHLLALIDAGIRSFKIEGRLKDVNYVKNVTAHYRQVLDTLIETNPQLKRASSGYTQPAFTPDPAKSFYRGGTDYFLNRKRNRAGSILTPKSTGKILGKVKRLLTKGFVLDTSFSLNNGDGLCFFDASGRLVGCRVNRVSGREIHTREAVELTIGTEIYRNHDVEFLKLLAASKGCRSVRVSLRLWESREGLHLGVDDEDGIHSEITLAVSRDTAAKPGAAKRVAEKQLIKCGGTIFTVENVKVEISEASFYPAAAFNEIRRLGLEGHRKSRIVAFFPKDSPRIAADARENRWPGGKISYRENILNATARSFYLHRQAEITEELVPGNVPGCALMTTKYCVRAQLNICANEKRGKLVSAGSLLLTDQSGEYELVFHCSRCEMTVHRSKR